MKKQRNFYDVDVHTVYLDAAAVRGERKPILLRGNNLTIASFEELMKQNDGQLDKVEGADLVAIEKDLAFDDFDEAA